MRHLAAILACTTGAACAAKTPRLTSGVAVENFDRAVQPHDDFYTFVNGKWLERTKIPDDKSNYGVFTQLADAAEVNLEAIVKEVSTSTPAAGTDAFKLGALYNSFMDTAAIEKLGLEPLAAELKAIDEVASKDDVARRFGRFQRIGARSPVYFYVDQDAKNTTAYIGYLHQSGLGLPDRDYYFKEDAKFAGFRDAYVEYLTAIMALSGKTFADDAAASVMALERRLAEAHWTRTQNRDRDKTYNKRTLEKLSADASGLAWGAYFEGAGMKAPDSVIVRQPNYAEAMARIVDETPVEVWKAYLTVHLLSTYAPLLNAKFVETNFGFYGRTLRGITQNRPRWKRGIAALNEILGEALGKLYVQRHFKPEAKARMAKLVENLVAAFESGIDGLEWMGPETKKQAQAKLAKFIPKIGYPDRWRDYSKLSIDKGALVTNVLNGRVFEFDRHAAKLGGPIDRDEWFMTPQRVNAYYNPSMNEIVFPAAILQPPFFNLEADDAVNYGAIGAVIGHELSHGFDDQGRKSDGDGMLRDWWTEEDATKFKARAQKLSEQYATYEPLPGSKLNGDLTLGENIGDLGGLTIAYRAYRLSLGGKDAPVIDDLTGDQRFFVGWAQIWRRKYREAELQRRLLTDPHSPSHYRVIGVLANMPEFYEAWNIAPGTPMHRDDAQRVKIW